MPAPVSPRLMALLNDEPIRLPLQVTCGVKADYNLPLFERPDVPEKVLAIFHIRSGEQSGPPRSRPVRPFCHKMCIIHEIENAEKEGMATPSNISLAYSPFTRNVVGKRENWIDYFLFAGQRGEGI